MQYVLRLTVNALEVYFVLLDEARSVETFCVV